MPGQSGLSVCAFALAKGTVFGVSLERVPGGGLPADAHFVDGLHRQGLHGRGLRFFEGAPQPLVLRMARMRGTVGALAARGRVSIGEDVSGPVGHLPRLPCGLRA